MTILTLKQNKKILFFLFAGIFLAFTVFSGWVSPSTANAATVIPVNQCNGVENTGGLNVECTVTVVNNLDMAKSTTSSSTTVKVCEGAAGAAPTCTTTVEPSTSLVSAVTQCNGSGNGGGATVTCKVNIVNNIVGKTTTIAATVNQCIDSGTGGGTEPTTLCDPSGNTTNADITQCNSSGNGGGATIRVKCNVVASTESSILPVTVNQCVGSGNGGGALVTCDVSILNQVTAPPATTPPATTPPATTPPATTPHHPATTPPATTPHHPATTPPGTNNRTNTEKQLAKTGSDMAPPLLGGAGILLAGLTILLVSRLRKDKSLQQ